MLRVMVYKELRETLVIAVCAMAVYLWLGLGGPSIGFWPLGWLPIGGGRESYPFLSGQFLGTFLMASTVFAAALGLRQTVSESARGTWLLLLHRPVVRRWLIVVKLLVGTALFCICAAIPILIYGWRVAAPGSFPGPFEWSMTADSWAQGASLIGVYLAAFLSGIRPGRWLGTRLLPLAGTVILVFSIHFLTQWPLFWGALAVLGAVLVVLILFVARTRDYS
jgi:magnesium-transporting ATPase (P-type)